jgi:hypothetical protein
MSTSLPCRLLAVSLVCKGKNGILLIIFVTRYLAVAMANVIRSCAPLAKSGGDGEGLVIALDHAPPLLSALTQRLRRIPMPAATLVRPWLGDGREGCEQHAPYDAIILGAGMTAVATTPPHQDPALMLAYALSSALCDHSRAESASANMCSLSLISQYSVLFWCHVPCRAMSLGRPRLSAAGCLPGGGGSRDAGVGAARCAPEAKPRAAPEVYQPPPHMTTSPHHAARVRSRGRRRGAAGAAPAAAAR